MEDDIDESDNENHIISETKPISLPEAKQAAVNLHHFFYVTWIRKWHRKLNMELTKYMS